MKVFPDFENELKAMSPRLTIILNPNRPGLANVKLDGSDVIPVPADEIYDEPNPNYRYTFPNGYIARHKSREEVLSAIKSVMNITLTQDGADAFHGRGEYESKQEK